MLKIGLTGNIGSGKSLVAKIFETLRIPVFYADTEAKKILNSPEVIQELIKLFGQEIITGQSVDKKALAQIVFSDKSSLQKLNEIIHPAVRMQFTLWTEQQNDAPYILYEAAILLESGHYKSMDKIIVVTASEDLRVKRVMKRDKVKREMVLERMANQWPEKEKTKHADYLINNNETELLIPQVVKIHEIITNSLL